MAFTDNCDLYVAMHEDGVNRVIEHIMCQRPSWFNYASADVAGDREKWCESIDFTQDVTAYGNPLFTVVNPIPVLGTDAPPVRLGFCAQLVKAELDFHPSSRFDLPPELNPPLQEQQFALFLIVCGAIACPDDQDIDGIPPVQPQGPGPLTHVEQREPIPPVDLSGEMNCFCLEVYVVGHIERITIGGQERLLGRVDGVEIVDIEPSGLESNLECYIRTAASLVLRQKLAIPLSTLFYEFSLFGMGTVTLSPTPPPTVPHNPAVEEDQIKGFVTMTVT